VHGQIGAFHIVKFGLDFLLGRVHDDRGALAKDQLLDLDEAKQAAVTDLAGIDLVDLALIHEQNLENVTRCHLGGSQHC